MKRKGFFETPTMKKAIKFAAEESTKEQVKVLKKAGFKFPMKRIKKEVEKKKHIHRYKVYGSTAVCKCGQIKVKSSPKPTKVEKLIEEIEIRGITITMEDISYFPCIESGTWKRFKKEINNLLSH